MATVTDYPGTPQHQAFLKAVAFFYADDPRILAVNLYGSLARRDWDPYSNIDLDIVLADGIQIPIAEELRRLGKFVATIGLGERVTLVLTNGADAGNIIFDSLMELAIHYHLLQATPYHLVAGFQVLAGQIDSASIRAAGLANRNASHEPPTHQLDMCIRYARDFDIALQRRELWAAIEFEHRLRTLLMDVFTQVHGGHRAFYTFLEEVDTTLQARLAVTLPQYDLRSVQRAFLHLLYILEHNLVLLAGGTVQLTDAHRDVLDRIRLRQADLHLVEPAP